MSQSLAKVYLHLVFSTKYRERVIRDDHRMNLHAYMGGILKGSGGTPIEINTEPDHAHILFLLGRTTAISHIVANVKKSSTDWLRSQCDGYRGFHWQAGYGCFSVDESSVAGVRQYIRHQREHHSANSFEDEYRLLLRQHQVEFDELYVWD